MENGPKAKPLADRSKASLGLTAYILYFPKSSGDSFSK